MIIIRNSIAGLAGLLVNAMTRFTVNGNPVEYLLDPDTPLLWALRDASHLTGAKYGCDDGSCGACTVIVDGNATRSCTVSIRTVEGRFVTTIEALSPARNHPLQQAMLAENVVQCGFCTSGILMAASALLAGNRNPNDAEIDAAIDNICRCGTYPRMRRAIRRAADAMRGVGTLAPTEDETGTTEATEEAASNPQTAR